MKRFLFLTLLCSPLFFTSCGDQYYDGAAVNTSYVLVQPGEWYRGAPSYVWEAYKDVPAITSDVIENGAVLVYAVYDDADIQLPDVFSDSDGGSDFVQIYGYQVTTGGIYFTVEASDFQTTRPNETIEYKIVTVR